MNREYSIKLECNNRTIYKEKCFKLEDCCERVFWDYVKMNILDSLLDNIELKKTKCISKDYFKTVLINNDMPDLHYSIKKLSPGDISIDSIKNILTKKKEEYERTYYKLRNKRK